MKLDYWNGTVLNAYVAHGMIAICASALNSFTVAARSYALCASAVIAHKAGFCSPGQVMGTF
jgi:hypothetical protein